MEMVASSKRQLAEDMVERWKGTHPNQLGSQQNKSGQSGLVTLAMYW